MNNQPTKQPVYPSGTMMLQVILRKMTALSLRIFIILDFILGGYGKPYGVRLIDRAWLVIRFHRIVRAIRAGTPALYHIILSREILSIPPDVPGVVMECGVWKGASSASLSLVCHLTGRRLLLCDSFAGLPDEGISLYVAPHSKTFGYLKGGFLSASLSEVQTNIQLWGKLEVCDFIVGMFADSLQKLTQPIVFAFLDVDMPSSFRDCLRPIWPLLVESGVIFVDDVGWMNVVTVFFDEMWWLQNLGCSAPGLIGSGCGLPIHPTHSNLGYVRKMTHIDLKGWKPDLDLYFPEDDEVST